MVKGIRDGGWGGGGFIMMERIHYEVADCAARSVRSDVQRCAGMDGEWKSGGMGIEDAGSVSPS